MEEIQEVSKPEEKKEVKLNRRQQREVDRINKDAAETYARLSGIFYSVFMANDPDSDVVTTKEKELNAKWRMYCKRNQLIPASFDALSNYFKLLHTEYDETLNAPQDDKSGTKNDS